MTRTPPGGTPLPVSTHPLEYPPVTLNDCSSQRHLPSENENVLDTALNNDIDYNIPLPPPQELLQTAVSTTATTSHPHQHHSVNDGAQQSEYTMHDGHTLESSFMYNLSVTTAATAALGGNGSNNTQQKVGRNNITSISILSDEFKTTETPYLSSTDAYPSTPIPVDTEVSSSLSTTATTTVTAITPVKEGSENTNTLRGYRSNSMRVKRSDQVRAMMGEVPQNMPSLFSNHTFTDSTNKSFKLTVVEQPKSCRVTGFSNSSDRRPIDPTPIVSLLVTDQNQRIDQESLQNPFYVLHVSLASSDKTKQYDVVVNYPRSRSSNSSTMAVAATVATASTSKNRSRASSSSSSSSASSLVGAEITMAFSDTTPVPEEQQVQQEQQSIPSSSSFAANEEVPINLKQHQHEQQPSLSLQPLPPSRPASEEEMFTNSNRVVKVLVGPLVSSASTFKGLDDKPGIFFAFPGLSVRVLGTYRLHFSLLSLGRSDKVLAEEYSEPFTVYKAKTFPGMEDAVVIYLETSTLALHLYNQGLKLPLRTKPRQKRKQST